MSLFVHPITMGRNSLWLVLPLCMVLAVIYKTIRVQTLRELPLQIFILWLYIIGGLIALGVVFYLLLEYIA